MCSPHGDAICCWREREDKSVLLENMLRKRKFRALSPPFILPEKIIRAEWDKSSPLDENMRRDHNGQINLRAKQKFEILSAAGSFPTGLTNNWFSHNRSHKLVLSLQISQTGSITTDLTNWFYHYRSHKLVLSLQISQTSSLTIVFTNDRFTNKRSHFDIIGSYGVILCYYQKTLSFSLLVSSSLSCLCHLMNN